MTNYEEKEKILARLLKMRIENHRYKKYIKQCTRTSLSMAAPEYRDSLKERHNFIMNDTKAIVARNNSIVYFLMRNVFKIDDEAITKYLDSLDELNKETLLYYANIVDIPGRLPRKNFDSVVESHKMAVDAVALLDNDKKVREYLGFEDDFWQYLDDPKKERLRHLDSLNTEVIEHMSFVCPMLSSDGEKVSGMIVQVPIVKNRETALRAIELYTRAYKYYKMLDSEFVKQTSDEEAMKRYVYNLTDRATKSRILK